MPSTSCRVVATTLRLLPPAMQGRGLAGRSASSDESRELYALIPVGHQRRGGRRMPKWPDAEGPRSPGDKITLSSRHDFHILLRHCRCSISPLLRVALSMRSERLDSARSLLLVLSRALNLTMHTRASARS